MKTEVSTTGLVVTLPEVKRALRVTHDSLDMELLSLIDAAIRTVEAWSNRTIRPEVERKITCSRWPSYQVVQFFDPPLISVDAVKYFDSANIEQTLDPSNYRVQVSTDGVGRLEFDGDTWDAPDLYDRLDAVAYEYTSGYGLRSAIPVDLKLAVKLEVQATFMSDEASHRAAQAFARRNEVPVYA
jgi:uncharacterized phiE125 gp8 family phage protein